MTGPQAADYVDITAPPAVNIRQVTKAKNSTVEDVTVVILDRPHHKTLAKEVREAGARIKLIRTATWPAPSSPPARAAAWT